ncbi:MAG: 4-alpha-glucanotransferase [Chromatiaceae bacterium]|nr:4-alpha-glucanotransferase [Chromatiaceae bacterium]
MDRTSGILLHATSLPGPFGIGDLGPAACRFVDFLEEAGQGLWQMLPIGPTGFGDSPYQCLSAFAGNPLLISPESLAAEGWLEEADLRAPGFPADCVDFDLVKQWKSALFRKAFLRFTRSAPASCRAEYAAFRSRHGHWLDDYALFASLKDEHHDRPWTQWGRDFSLREPGCLDSWASTHARELDFYRFIQFVFFRQWQALREYANGHHVCLIGDVPIFVAHDSSEVWQHPEWFQLDDGGHPTVVAGVPPDYFSATGQRWGNPLYDWDRLAADGYAFWLERLRGVFELVDLVRIDHFRGFAGYWEIPAEEQTAVNGRWVPGPGRDLFGVLRDVLGDDLPLIAEDLGVITEDVKELRDSLGFPGMAILQFAFEPADEGFGVSDYLPHNHRRNLVVYTGTHDNNTVLGWWQQKPEAVRAQVRAYLNTSASEINRDFIRCALASVARYAIFPIQDILGLGAEACMNRPGKAEGNWSWRFTQEDLNSGIASDLKGMTELYGRGPLSTAKNGIEGDGSRRKENPAGAGSKYNRV